MKTDAGRRRPLPALGTAVAAALLLLAACSEGDIQADRSEMLPEGKYPVALTADVVNETRATTDGTWKGDEQVAVQDVGSDVTKIYTVGSGGGLTPSDANDAHWWTSTTETKTLRAWHRGDGSTAVPTSWEIQTDQSDGGYQKSDLLYAGNVTATFGSTATTLQFRHQVAKVVVNIISAEAVTSADQISAVTIGNGDIFQSGSISIADDATDVTWATGTTTCTVTPHKATTTATGSVATYEALLIPQPTAGKKMVAVTTTDNDTYYYTAPDDAPALEAGKVLTYNITVKKNGGADAQTINVGDFILKDGTILPKGTTLTETQKADVRAIVFWTPAETSSTGRTTPASLADDKVMANDFPKCTRGLAVAIKNVSTSTTWQRSNHAEVFDLVRNKWKDDTWTSYKLGERSSYRTASSGTGAENDLNKIYGYQDTKVLTAYNKNQNSSTLGTLATNCIVEPANKLSGFSLTSPQGSTGWFLPSVKELHMMCYKDVDDVFNAHGNSGYTETRDIVNASIKVAGGEALSGYYWSSLEYPVADKNTNDYKNRYAFCVNFSNAEVAIYHKTDHSLQVRAICAF